MKKWQDEWRDNKAAIEGVAVKNARSGFHSYIFTCIKGSRTRTYGASKDLVFLLIRTGKPVDVLLRCLIADIQRKINDPNYKPPETEKRKFKTPAQKAKKARDRYRYAINKSAAYCEENNLCNNCMDDNTIARMRCCMRCLLPVCEICMTEQRKVCPRCPEMDLIIAEDDALGFKCQKCGVLDDRGLRRCGECKLGICRWCSMIDRPECAARCPSHPYRVTDKLPSQVLHKYANDYVERVQSKTLDIKARKLTAYAREPRRKSRSQRVVDPLSKSCIAANRA